MPSGTRPRPLTNSVRMALSGAYAGSRWAHIFWLNTTVSATPTPTELADLMTAVEESYVTRILPLLSTAVEVQDGKAVFFESSSTEVAAEVGYTDTGGVSTAGLTAQAAVCLSWSISAYYRGGHPRTYLPGIPAAAMGTVTFLEATHQAAFQNAGAEFLSDVNALSPTPFTNVTLGTESFQTGNAFRVTPVFRDYLTCTVHPRLDTQRRRLGKETV